MDLVSINTLLSPANTAIATNLRLLRDFRERGISAFAPTQTTNPQVSAPGFAAPPMLPANQALYLQSMMFQMNHTNSLLAQMSTLFGTLLHSGINLKEAGLSDEQLAFLHRTVSAFPGGAGGNGPAPDPSEASRRRNAAISHLAQFLKKEHHEGNCEDEDNDGNLVGEGDLAGLKAALDEGLFTKADLAKAFQYLLAKGNTAGTDELLELFTLAEKESLVHWGDLLKPRLIPSLDDERQVLLANHIAQGGLVDGNDRTRSRLIGFLIGSLAENAEERLKHFGTLTMNALAAQWPCSDETSRNRELLESLATITGFSLEE